MSSRSMGSSGSDHLASRNESGSTERHHDDPFDRVLVAQAQEEQLVLVS